MTTGITQYKLENGLMVSLKEIHTAPIVSHWVSFRVGSRDELPGKTGLSHWVEHMQFKGTPQFPNTLLDKTISRHGGIWNAFTYLDWTAYFETLPADKLELAIQIESDRMVNCLYSPKEVESERSVIISEREGHENEPLFRLDEAIQHAAFDSHPYRYGTIGEKKDLRRISREDLYNHYQTYYAPGNAVLAIAGDFNTDIVIPKIKEIYGAIKTGCPAIHNSQHEPPPGSERRLEVRGPGETTYLQLAYRSPQAAHDDFFAFSVLNSLLTGPSGLSFFGGGGISNKTSRLYRSLVEKDWAISVGGGLQATIDPFFYEIMITVRPDQKPGMILDVVDNEICRLQDSLVPTEEIDRAIKQARALFAYSTENITNQAFWLGYAEMFASYDWFVHYVDHLSKITPADIQRIAQEYLRPSRRVVGTYLPGKRKRIITHAAT